MRGLLRAQLERDAAGGVFVDRAQHVDSGEWHNILTPIRGDVMHLIIFEPIVCNSHAVPVLEVKKSYALWGACRSWRAKRNAAWLGIHLAHKIKIAVVPVVVPVVIAIPVPGFAMVESPVKQTIPEEKRLARVSVTVMVAEEPGSVEWSVPGEPAMLRPAAETGASQVPPSAEVAAARMTYVPSTPVPAPAMLCQRERRQRQAERSHQGDAKEAIDEDRFHGSPSTG